MNLVNFVYEVEFAKRQNGKKGKTLSLKIMCIMSFKRVWVYYITKESGGVHKWVHTYMYNYLYNVI